MVGFDSSVQANSPHHPKHDEIGKTAVYFIFLTSPTVKAAGVPSIMQNTGLLESQCASHTELIANSASISKPGKW